MYDKLNITSPKKGIIFCRTVVFLWLKITFPSVNKY